MIDTVVMVGDYIIDPEYLRHIEWTDSFQVTREGVRQTKYEYKKKDAPARIWYDQGNHRLTIECSIPKFLWRNNVQMVTTNEEVATFLVMLDLHLKEQFAATCLNSELYSWQVQRMDVCWNFQVGDSVKDYITALKQLKIPKYETVLYNGDETVIWQNKTRRMHFYDKEQQVRKSRSDKEIIEQTKGILRFESKFVSNELSRNSEHRWAKELLDIDTVRLLLQKRLTVLGLDKPHMIGDQAFVTRRLHEQYGAKKAMELLGFILFLTTVGREAIADSTYRRKKKELKDAGVSPYFSSRTLPPLDLSGLN